MSVMEEYGRRLAEWSDIQDHLPFLHETVLGYGRTWRNRHSGKGFYGLGVIEV